MIATIESTATFLGFGLGMWEVIVILLVVLILFGAKKLPELAKGLGTGIKEFKKATRDVQEDLQRAIEDEPASSRRTTPVDATQPKAEKRPAEVAHD